MPLYAYKAMNASGRILRGQVDAANLVDLEMRLKRLALDFIDGAPVMRRSLFGAGVRRRELIHFCFHLEQLTRAGVSLVDSLIDLRDSAAQPRFREMLADMVENIGGGKTLSQAMATHPRIFDEVMVSLIRSGEDTGQLPEVLGNLLASLKWQDELTAHAKKAVLYPAFLGAVVLALIVFMMAYLVPQMVGFTKSMGQALPLQTEILIAMSGVIVDHGSFALLTLITSGAALVAAIRTQPHVRRYYDHTKLRIPLLGNILRKTILARFASTFALMYGSGISVLDAMRATEKVVGNMVIAEGLRRAGRMVAEGENIATAFDKVGLFPPLVTRMLHVGESTGALDRALANVGYFYRRDVHESVERLQVLIEPTMTVAIGTVMGWIMLSALAPIYDVIVRLSL